MQSAFLAVAFALQGLTLVSLWAVMYQVIRQQGRLLLRLDELGRRLPQPGPDGEEERGLAVGAPITPFRLTGLDGREVSSEGLLGRRTLLVHWSAACGFCELLAPDLARLQGGLHARGVQLVLAGRGDPSANRDLA